MSDSFADLWNSSTPIKPAPPPQKLGSVAPPTSNLSRPRPDVFSLLSSAGSSAPTSRPRTPSTAGQSASSKPPNKGPLGDAFSGLAGSLGATTNGAKLTIAERAAKAEKERIENLQKRREASKAQTPSTWDGLDALAQASAPKPLALLSTHALDDDWGIGSTVSSKPASIAVTPPEEDDWGLGDFASKRAEPLASRSASAAAPHSKAAIWEFDDFSSPPASTSRPSPPSVREPVPRANSPGDFDFGEYQDGPLDDDSPDENDILGVLSKPVDAIPQPTSLASRSTQPKQTSRPVSPPPHILGQIVEMGFSPQQARIALAATDTGLDVQVALETLLSNGVGSESSPPPLPDRSRFRGHDEELVPRPPRRAPNAGPRVARHTPSPSGSQQERDIRDQADKLLAQASEIGLSVFNRANAFWAQGKEKVQKVYEERAKASAVTRPEGGRPKWMQDEVPVHDEGVEGEWAPTGFSDGAPPARPSRSTRPNVEQRPQAQSHQAAAKIDLFSDEPVAYVSPFRRGRPKTTSSAENSLARSSSPKPALRSVSPIPLTQRQAVSASAPVIASSAKHKSIGAEKFKLGQYSEAEAAYTAAIDVLPESHLLLVPLYNNRALTRLKTGDHTGAVEDSSTVIRIVGSSYHPQREAKVASEWEGAAVDLSDGLVKAWKRRAEAYEGKEKWALAQKDWESVAAVEWASGKTRSEAVRGAGRCRRTAQANNADSGIASSSTSRSPVKSSARPAPPKPPIYRGPTPPSQALSKLREANNAAEAEDQARHELKDAIDVRLVAWKGGKEANIRALIASLDAVLWPELGWQKVGMGDLITPSQVKVRYTKAIAKLHPDKLNANDTTLEQRMIANGVFGALNEAWNVFKQ